MQTRIEIIAKTCFPLFDSFIESALQQAEASPNDLKVVCSGVYEIGPNLGHGGVCFEALHLPLDDVMLGAGFHVFGPNADSPPVLRVTVSWSRPWTLDRQAGFCITEFTATYRPNEPEEAHTWVSHALPDLKRAMTVAIKRGRPPSRAKHWLQRVLGKVPPAQILTLPSGSLSRFPDIATFKKIYDKQVSV